MWLLQCRFDSFNAIKMASLKEIKGRIASVRNTLKITSAMKMVAAAKLHRAQQAFEGMLPYENALQEMLARLQSSVATFPLDKFSEGPLGEDAYGNTTDSKRPVVLVLFTSNSSLCGGFNANVIKRFFTVLDEFHADGYEDDAIHICTIGKKGAEAVRKAGMQLWMDCSKLADHPEAQGMAALASHLMQEQEEGRIERLCLVYNHYASNASQPTRVEDVPFPSSIAIHAAHDDRRCGEFIVEPSCTELLNALQPRVFRQKLYSTLLDAQAAEHAARTVAMQTASDNAENLLEELTLEYNKSRQQKITAEILDLVGGQKR